MHCSPKKSPKIDAGDIPGVPKKSSGVWLNAEKKVLNLAISNQSSEMLDIST